jgi:predicted transcriptional regulator
MNKTLPFSMRLDPDLKAKLSKLADKENRSLTNYIETLLRQHVEAAEKKPSRK